MQNVSIPARLVILSAPLLTILVCSILYFSQRLSQNVEVLGQDALLVRDLKSALDTSKAFGDLKYWLLELAVDNRPRSEVNALESRREVESQLARLERFDAESVAVLRLEVGALMDTTLIAIENYNDGQPAQGDAFLAKGLAHVRVVDRRLAGVVEGLEVEVAANRDMALSNTQRAVTIALSIGLITTALGLALTVWVVRSITVPLRRLVSAMAAITSGELDTPIPTSTGGEIGVMARTLGMFRDSLWERNWLVAEQKRAEATLQRVQTRLSEAIESISEGFALYDVEDRLLTCNRRYRDFVAGGGERLAAPGATFEEVVRDSTDAGLIREAVGREDAWIAERLERHRNPTGPHIHERRDGRWLQINERKTQDGGTVAVYMDITELKRREEELAAANRQKDVVLGELHVVLDAIDYGVLFMDAELNVRLTNRAYREIWGFPDDFREPGRNLNLSDYYKHTRPLYMVDDADWKAFLTRRMDAIRRGVTDPPESRLANGKTLKRECIELPDGGRMLTYFDITELKRTEAALRESEERYALAVKGTNDGLWDWSAQSNQIYVSPRFKAIVGLRDDSDYLSPDDWTARIHHEDLPQHVAAMGAHLSGETSLFAVEYRVRGDDGHYRWVLNRGLGLRDGARIHRMAGSLSDMTARKETEIALREAKEQAEAATRTKSQFLANMSHELRTPLNAIIGIGEMLMEEAEDDRRDDIIEPLRRVVTAGRHLLGLINNVLDLSKIEAGRLEVVIDDFSVPELVHQVTATAEPLAAKNHNVLRIHCEVDAGKMRSDLIRVRQILLNLLSNACKFTERGEVELAVEQSRTDGDEWLTFTVRDTGIGMKDTQLEGVFEEFTQGDDSTTRRYGGTGLGLAITRRLCRLLGGDIDVASRENEGTTFTVTLPTPARYVQRSEGG